MPDLPTRPPPDASPSDPFSDRTDVSHTNAEMHRLIERAIAATNNAVMITDSHLPDNPIIYVNRAFERLSGYTSDEVLGYNCRFMQYRSNGMRDANQRGVDALRWAVCHKEPARVILRNYRKSGEKFWSEMHLAPFADEETGELRYFVSIQRNITERIEHNRSFEREVATRIQALKEERDALKHTRASLARNMNHEVRDTLTTILGLANLIQEETTSDTAFDTYAARIKAEGKRLMDTLSSLQEDIGIQNEELEPAIVAEIVRDAVEHMPPSTLRDDLSLSVTVAPEARIATAQLDAEHMTSVLHSLITTVMLRPGAQGGTVRVYTTERSGTPYVAVDVQGKGVTISKDLHPLLFERSTYEPSGADSGHDGSGIDLSMTREWVESMDGTLTMETTPKVGTTFTILLPRVPEKEPEERTEASPHQSARSVLIVEDNESTAFLLQSLLENTASLSTASNAAEAIIQAEETTFDLFLVDINLGPGHNGIEVLNRLRAMDRYADTPIVAVTAMAMRGDRERFLDEGFDAYLAKPFTTDTLLKTVNRHLD